MGRETPAGPAGRVSRHVCVHGHFYQPPRENPWLEAIERQDSAAPYHDWNERVAAECYAPNAAARILGPRGRILRLANNYERISFDVGPTLMSWLEAEAPRAYRAILEADARRGERDGGHGPAMAQAYGHPILPLTGDRDRRTQVAWGIRDFERRFGRRPEGMWLPETAVDLPTLEALAEAGIRFTVLAPHQAARWRPLGAGEEAWRPASEGLDTRRAYLQRLPSGREVALFFYDGALARAVAFEGLLADGDRFADRLLRAFDGAPEESQLVHLATDGETFGHHHRHGEMALAFALERLERAEGVQLTTYGRFLEGHPPAHEVELAERTSWSCAHGVERWRADCGCRTGGEPGWDQAWRAPLREALDWLRGRVDPAWERAAGELFPDPWGARDAYIDVVLDRSTGSVDRFLTVHARGGVSEERRVRALELMELQRHALLVYTSCGWFFNDLAGIETVQVLRYAARVVELAERRLGEPLRDGLLERLARARSNLPERGDGRAVWEREVEPAAVDHARVAAHHAVRSLVDLGEARAPGEVARVYAFRVEERATELEEAGSARLRTGAVRVVSEVTGEAAAFLYGALHLGGHQLTAGVRSMDAWAGTARAGATAAAGTTDPAVAVRAATAELREAFGSGDLAGAARRLGDAFGPRAYSLRDLLRDEQRRIVDRILRSTLEEAEAVHEGLYARYAPLMRFVADLGVPQPAALEAAGELVLAGRLRRRLEEDPPDLESVASLLAEARSRGVALEGHELEGAFRAACLLLARRAAEAPGEAGRLADLDRAVELVRSAPVPVDLGEVEDAYWELSGSAYPPRRERAAAGDAEAATWVERFLDLGRRLGFAVEDPIPRPSPPPSPAPAAAATPPGGSSR